jgi:outer membrane protein
VKSLVDHALKNRPDVAASTLSIQNAQLEMQIAETGHYPRVSNYLTLGAENSTPGTMFDNRSYSFGFSLDVPIFSGWNVETKTEIAAIEAKIRTIQHDDLKRDISRAVSKAFLDLQSAAKQLEVNKKNVTAATENRRIEEEKYALGSTSLLNVLIANSDYTGAVSNLINTQYQFRKVNDQLLYLTGALHAK